MKIKEIREARTKVLGEAKALTELAEKEGRDLTAEEKVAAEKMLTEAKELRAKIEEYNKNSELMQQILDIGGAELPEFGYKRDGTIEEEAERGSEKRTLGEQFTQSKEWKQYLKHISASDGRIPESLKGISSPAIAFKSLLTGSSNTSAGAFVLPEQTGIVEGLGRYPQNIRNLISVRQTTSDAVEFMRQTKQITEAAMVPEANVTNYTGATGQVSGLKPEGALTWERVIETVKTLAVWIPATKRALSDAAQLRGIIDQELRQSLSELLENQIINGNGSGENFTGITNTSGTLVQGFDTSALVTTRKAVTNLLVNGKETPTAWLMNPADWEFFELQQDGSDRFYWGGPLSRGQTTLWGVPVFQSFYVPEGMPILANFSKAILWDRETATITATDSHADFFIRNIVAILGESRAAFGITKPSAFVEVDINGGS